MRDKLPDVHPCLVGMFIGMALSFILCKITGAYDASIFTIIIPLAAAIGIFIWDWVTMYKFISQTSHEERK